MADLCVKRQKQTTTPTQRALGTSCSLQLRETTLASLFINIRSQIKNLGFNDKYTELDSFSDFMIDVNSDIDPN